MSISFTTPIPGCLLDSLKQFDDIKVRDGEIPVFELVNSRGANSAFLDFLGDDNEVDPLMYPSFGSPLNPYVDPVAQIEVFNLLATFQHLKTLDLIANVFPFIVAQFPLMGGFQYHHSNRFKHKFKTQRGLRHFVRVFARHQMEALSVI